MLRAICVCLIVAISTYTDFRYRKIYNIVTLPAIVFGLLFNYYTDGTSGIIFALKGLLLGIGILFIPFILGGMGGGEVKLFGAIGAWMGAWPTLNIFIYSAIFGGVVALLLMLRRGGFRRLKNIFYDLLWFLMVRERPSVDVNKEEGIPYGIVIAIGGLLYILGGDLI